MADILRTVKVVLEATDKSSPVVNEAIHRYELLESVVAGLGIHAAFEKIAEAARWVGEQIHASLERQGEFDEALARTSVITRATGDQMLVLAEQAKTLGATTKYQASVVMQAMTAMANSELNAAQIFQLMPRVIAFAEAGVLDLSEAARLSAGVMRAFSLTAEQTAEAMDVIVGTATRSGQSIGAMAQAFKVVGPAARITKASMDDIGAALTFFSKQGLDAGTAGNALRMMLYAIVGKLDEGAKGLKDVSINAYDAQGNFVGLTEIIRKFGEAGIDSQRIIEIFGRRVGPQLALLLTAGAGQFEQYKKQLEEVHGLTERLAMADEANIGGAMRRTVAATTALRQELADGFAPAVKAVLDEAIVPWILHERDLARENGNLRRSVIELNQEVIRAAEGFIGFGETMAVAFEVLGGSSDLVRGMLHALNPVANMLDALHSFSKAFEGFKPSPESQKFAQMFALLKTAMESGSISADDYAKRIEELSAAAAASGVDTESFAFRLAVADKVLDIVKNKTHDTTSTLDSLREQLRALQDGLTNLPNGVTPAANAMTKFNEDLGTLGIETIPQLQSKVAALARVRSVLPNLGLKPEQVRAITFALDQLESKLAEAGAAVPALGTALDFSLRRIGVGSTESLVKSLAYVKAAVAEANKALAAGEIDQARYDVVIRSIDEIVKKLQDAGISVQTFGRDFDSVMGRAGQSGAKQFSDQVGNMNVAIETMVGKLGEVSGTDAEAQFLAMADALLKAADSVDGGRGLLRSLEKLRAMVRGSKDLFEQITGTNLSGVNRQVDDLASAYSKLIEEQGRISPDTFTKLREQIRQGAQGLYDKYGWLPGMEKLNTLLQEMPMPLLQMNDALMFISEHGLAALHEKLQATGEQIMSLGQTIKQNLGQIGVQAVQGFAQALVVAAFDGAEAFRQFFKQLMMQLIAAIIQALILRAIMAAIGFSGGGVAGGTSATAASPGMYHAAQGMITPGADYGTDVIPAMLRPGEGVLPPELTSFLLRAAENGVSGGGGGEPVVIHLRADVPLFVQKVNTGVQRGRVRVLATKVV